MFIFSLSLVGASVALLGSILLSIQGNKKVSTNDRRLRQRIAFNVILLI